MQQLDRIRSQQLDRIRPCPQGLARVPACATAQLPFGLCARVSFLAETEPGEWGGGGVGICPNFRARRSWDAARKPRVPSFWECGHATPSPAQMCPAPASSAFLVSVPWAWRSEPQPAFARVSFCLLAQLLSVTIRWLLVSSAALALTPVPVCQLPSNTTSPSSSCEPPSPLIYYLRNPTPARVQLPPFHSHFAPAQLETSSFDFPSLCLASLLTAFPLTTSRYFLVLWPSFQSQHSSSPTWTPSAARRNPLPHSGTSCPSSLWPSGKLSCREPEGQLFPGKMIHYFTTGKRPLFPDFTLKWARSFRLIVFPQGCTKRPPCCNYS